MFTNTCYACRMTISDSATRCPYCTSAVSMSSGGDPNSSYDNSSVLQWIGNGIVIGLCGWLVWYHLGNYIGWR